jgi:hypothetical protein
MPLKRFTSLHLKTGVADIVLRSCRCGKCTLQNLAAARHRLSIRCVRDAPANGSAYSRDLLAQEALARVDVPRILNVSEPMALRFALIKSDTCD